MDNPPYYTLSRQEKREAIRAALPNVKGATIRLDTPVGYYVGLLVLARRVGILPNVGDLIRFSRCEDSPARTVGWLLTLEPRISPHNGREHIFDEPWARERTNPVEGLLRALDPTCRPEQAHP